MVVTTSPGRWAVLEGMFSTMPQMPTKLALALRRASAAAALATTRIGAQSSIPTYDEVEALMRSNGGARGCDDTIALAAHCELTTYYGLQPLSSGSPNQVPTGEST